MLIHVPSIETTLKEFYRIVKPKGKVIIAEPNNLVNSVLIDSIEGENDLNYFKIKNEFELGYAIGKNRLNEGKSFSVESIPEILHSLGFINIQVFLSDKVNFGLEKEFENYFEEIYEADFMKSKKYLSAAGADETVHEAYWNSLKQYFERKQQKIKTNSHFDCKGSLMYLISAEKS